MDIHEIGVRLKSHFTTFEQPLDEPVTCVYIVTVQVRFTVNSERKLNCITILPVTGVGFLPHRTVKVQFLNEPVTIIQIVTVEINLRRIFFEYIRDNHEIYTLYLYLVAYTEWHLNVIVIVPVAIANSRAHFPVRS